MAVPVLRTRGIYLALATFALGQIVQAIILNLEIVGGAAGYPVAAFIRFPTIAAVAVDRRALVWLLFGTRFGIAVTAVHDDERVADLMGIDVRAFQIAAFALGSAIAGIGGGLYAHHFSFIEAQYFNISLSITIVLYVLLGGTQTVLGPLLGAAVFTLLPEVLRASANWRYVVFAAALIVLMALRPEGLVTGAQLRRLLGWHAPCRGRRGRRSAPDDGCRSHPALRSGEQAFRRPARDRGFELRGPARHPHGADRTERRRQDHGVQSHHRRVFRSTPVASGSTTSTSPTSPSRRRIGHGVARSFQNIRLMPHLSTLENVMVGQHCRNSGIGGVLQPVNLVPRNRWRDEARAALAEAGLGDYERATVGSLPYGVQKRIELVRALMARPRLLLLDEPAAGLNPAETEALQMQLERICAGGDLTLLVVEHDMHFVGALCEEVIVLDFGRKIAEGTPEEIRRNALVQEIYLGAPVAAPMEPPGAARSA